MSDLGVEGKPKTAFDRAIETGDVDTVRSLLAKGEKPSNGVMYDGHRADFPEVTKELIMAGLIDVNEDLENFCDVLCMAIEIAIEQHKVGSEFVEWLLAHGANPNSTHSDAGDENSLSIAAGAGRKD